MSTKLYTLFIGTSLREAHTKVTALHTCVYICLDRPLTIYFKWANYNISRRLNVHGRVPEELHSTINSYNDSMQKNSIITAHCTHHLPFSKKKTQTSRQFTGNPTLTCMLAAMHHFNIHSNYTSITTPQDAHKRLVIQVAKWLTAPLYYTRPEVEGFRDQGFVLQICLK